MPRYMIIRKFDVVEDEMPQLGRRSREAIEGEFPEITWEHSHVTIDDDGLVRTFCIYTAPDEEMIRRHSEVLGRHQIDSVREIAGDVTPGDFPGEP